MANSLNALLLQFLLMLIAAILFASLIYFVEQGEWDDEQGLWIYPEGSSTADGEASAFTSIVKGLWWCITTITTVGYGDMFPRTPGGKLVAICTFGAGLLSIAVPVAVVASNFSEQYEERKKRIAEVRGRVEAGRGDQEAQAAELKKMEAKWRPQVTGCHRHRRCHQRLLLHAPPSTHHSPSLSCSSRR